MTTSQHSPERAKLTNIVREGYDPPPLNEHNKAEYPPMHNGEFDTSPTKKTTLQCIDNMHYSVAFSWRISLLYLLHNTLLYPPHCIAHKTKATCLVIIFGSQYQTFVSSTNKFLHRQATTSIYFRNSNYET